MDVVTRSNIWLLPGTFSSLPVRERQLGVVYELKKTAKIREQDPASRKINEGKFRNHAVSCQIPSHTTISISTPTTAQRRYYQGQITGPGRITPSSSPFTIIPLTPPCPRKGTLDSVIYKCTAGILIHDTRNDWVDNLYLLIGKAFYLRKDFDSAYITFQFINYAFSPKKRTVTTRPSPSTLIPMKGVITSCFHKEKRNIAQKLFSLPPSRICPRLAGAHLPGQRKYADAAALIAVLRHDPEFPPRLAPELEEVQALWFYKQSVWTVPPTTWKGPCRELPHRKKWRDGNTWSDQLYERAGNPTESRIFMNGRPPYFRPYWKSMPSQLHPADKNKEKDYIQKNIDALVKMARKDRYEPYRTYLLHRRTDRAGERYQARRKGISAPVTRSAAGMEVRAATRTSFSGTGQSFLFGKNYPAAQKIL